MRAAHAVSGLSAPLTACAAQTATPPPRLAGCIRVPPTIEWGALHPLPRNPMPHRASLTALLILLLPVTAHGQLAEKPLPPKAPADRLDGPPLVSAKAWAIIDGKTGKFLWGAHENEPRAIASTTKIMTAWCVLRLAEADPK